MSNLTIVTLAKPDIQDFAAPRNDLLAHSPTDWVLFVDQDETVTPALKKELEQAVSSGHYQGYYLRRIDTFLGKQLRYGETGHVKLVRLGQKSAGRWTRPVHEVWEIKGRVGELKNPLLHNPHQSIADFLAKIDRYSTLEAQYRYDRGAKASLVHPLLFPLGKFFKNYLLLLGYRDGVPGLIMAMMMSFHSYLTWTKLYLLWRKK